MTDRRLAVGANLLGIITFLSQQIVTFYYMTAKKAKLQEYTKWLLHIIVLIIGVQKKKEDQKQK